LIDHALLDPHQGQDAILRCCDEARHFGCAGVCLGSRWMSVARERLPMGGPVRLISVVGFPFGAIPAAVKRDEAEAAVDAGADELDVVPDFGALADRDSRLLLDDLAAITSLGLPVKVIVESGRLEAEALELLVEVSLDAGVRFLKSGSGFGPPVSVAQVQRLRQLARGRGGIKAAGGVNSLELALDLALDQLGIDESEAQFEVLEEPRSGLFGRKDARLRARVKAT
jgi:deoxyribose-phosphate aldolase